MRSATFKGYSALQTVVKTAFATVGRDSAAHRLVHLLAAGLITLLATGCALNARPDSPDIKYSQKSVQAQQLQVPPDLTDISRGEQFVLPGDSGGVVARNTLLPGFESTRFVRNGADSWIETASRPEVLWPRLLSFLAEEKFEISRTQPNTGLLETQWRKTSGDSGTLKSLIVDSEKKVQRAGIRLERTPEGGSRVFVRHQYAADNPGDGGIWSAASASSAQTAALSQRLLVFLGLSEQRAKGILRNASVKALMAPAELQTTTAGANLYLYYGYKPSYEAIKYASATLGFSVAESDRGTGRVLITDDNGLVGQKGGSYELQLKPLHVSAVSVFVADKSGRKLDDSVERKLLLAIRDTLT